MHSLQPTLSSRCGLPSLLALPALVCHPHHVDCSPVSRHFIYVGDVAAAFIKILHMGVVGEVYNIGCEDESTNLEIAEKLVIISLPFVPFMTRDEMGDACLRD